MRKIKGVLDCFILRRWISQGWNVLVFLAGLLLLCSCVTMQTGSNGSNSAIRLRPAPVTPTGERIGSGAAVDSRTGVGAARDTGPATSPRGGDASRFNAEGASPSPEGAQPRPARAAVPGGQVISARRAGDNVCNQGGADEYVPAGAGSQSGTQIVRNFSSGAGAGRDRQFGESFACGNFPSHLSNLVPVEMPGGVTICVMPDYLSVGNEQDNIRFGLGRDVSTQLAASMGMILPTEDMVDAIYAQADVQLDPAPRTNYDIMTTTVEMIRHDQTIDQQLSRAGVTSSDLLVAGHKKDLVLSNCPENELPLYGWHRSEGDPIQNLGGCDHHGSGYVDYSHGVRFVSQIAFVEQADGSYESFNMVSETAPAGSSNPVSGISQGRLNDFSPRGSMCPQGNPIQLQAGDGSPQRDLAREGTL